MEGKRSWPSFPSPILYNCKIVKCMFSFIEYVKQEAKKLSRDYTIEGKYSEDYDRNMLLWDFQHDEEHIARIKRGQTLIDYIYRNGCRDCQGILTSFVKEYKVYCKVNGLEPEDINTIDEILQR